jgi:Rrf2 family protein
MNGASEKSDVNIQFDGFRRLFAMFSKSVEYALRAVVHLAHQAPDPCTTEQLAAGTRVDSLTYLSKVLQRLRKAGIVCSARGHGGGMTLGISPDRLTILEVVNAVEPIQRIRTCPLGLPGHGARLCPLHGRVDRALAMVETAFGNTTLAEVLAEDNGSPPLCDVPCGDRAEG